MNWGNWENFFAMGGYGLYVWGSMVVSFGLVAGEVIALRMQRRSLLRQTARWVHTNRGRKS